MQQHWITNNKASLSYVWLEANHKQVKSLWISPQLTRGSRKWVSSQSLVPATSTCMAVPESSQDSRTRMRISTMAKWCKDLRFFKILRIFFLPFLSILHFCRCRERGWHTGGGSWWSSPLSWMKKQTKQLTALTVMTSWWCRYWDCFSESHFTSVVDFYQQQLSRFETCRNENMGFFCLRNICSSSFQHLNWFTQKPARLSKPHGLSGTPLELTPPSGSQLWPFTPNIKNNRRKT